MTKNLRASLEYPKHLLDPTDTLTFVQAKPFSIVWDELGLSVADDLSALEVLIMASPKGPPVIQGTRGLRKIRFSPPDWNCGKRGALRVCYLFIEQHSVVVLLLAYPKSEKDGLTSIDKKRINSAIEAIEKDFDR